MKWWTKGNLSSLKWYISYLLSQCRKAYSYGQNFLDGPITFFSLQCNLKVVVSVLMRLFDKMTLNICYFYSPDSSSSIQAPISVSWKPFFIFLNYHQYTLVCVHSINIFNLVYYVLWAQGSTNHIVLTWDYLSGLHASICENKYLKTIRYK